MSLGLCLAAALVLDALFGEPRWLWARLPHPAVLMGRGIALLDRRLNHGDHQRLKGVLALVILAAGAMATGWILAQFGAIVEILAAAILLAQRSLADHVRAVADGLRLSVGDGRLMVGRIVSRNTRDMNQPQVARAAIESGAENLSDGVIAPAFWFLVAGLPGLLLYKAVNTADSMIGYRNERYERFGWAAARLDDVLNMLPARLTGFSIAALGGQLHQWGDIQRDARAHRSPNAGWPEAAMARSLNIALAGPRSYDGQVRDLAWVNGDANRQIGPDKIDASITMLWRVWACALLVALGVALLGQLSLL